MFVPCTHLVYAFVQIKGRHRQYAQTVVTSVCRKTTWQWPERHKQNKQNQLAMLHHYYAV